MNEAGTACGSARRRRGPHGKTFSQGELDQLFAPIALYSNLLLAQVLMASTHPLEVVEAARWVKAPTPKAASRNPSTKLR